MIQPSGKWWIDTQGSLPVMQAQGHWQALAAFIHSDLQYSRSLTAHLLDLLQSPEPDPARTRFIGNAHELQLDGEQVIIENLVDALDETGEADEQSLTPLPKDEVIHALSAWHQALVSKDQHDEATP